MERGWWRWIKYCQPMSRLRFSIIVEDRLLSADGFRQSTTLDTVTHELVRAGLTRAAAAEAIARLVDARLLTSEERGGIRRIELTHDILTSVARRSRDARVEHEAAASRRRQRTRLIGFILGLALLVAGVSVPLAVWALRERASAQKQEKDAVAAKVEAEKQKQDAVTARRILRQRTANSCPFWRRQRGRIGSWPKKSCSGGRMAKHWRTSPGRAATRQNPPLPAEAALSAVLSSPIAHLQATFQGHTGLVESAVFSPDGRRVLTAQGTRPRGSGRPRAASSWPLSKATLTGL